MILISAHTLREAKAMATKIGINSMPYLYVPQNPQERQRRKEVLRGIYGCKINDLYGEFSYEEQERVCRSIG